MTQRHMQWTRSSRNGTRCDLNIGENLRRVLAVGPAVPCIALYLTAKFVALQERKESGSIPGTDELYGENATRNQDTSSNGMEHLKEALQ